MYYYIFLQIKKNRDNDTSHNILLIFIMIYIIFFLNPFDIETKSERQNVLQIMERIVYNYLKKLITHKIFLVNHAGKRNIKKLFDTI